MKLVCHSCGLPMKIEATGIALIETFQYPPEPYKVWRADQYCCPGCGHVATYTDAQPELNHFDSDFAERMRSILNVGLYTVSYERLAYIFDPRRDEWKERFSCTNC